MQIYFVLIFVAIASFFGTITGFGTSTLLIPLLIDSWGGQETLLFVGIIHWFGDLIKLLLFHRFLDRRIFFIVAFPAVAAAFCAGFLPAYLSSFSLKRLIAGVIALYGAVIVFGFKIRLPASSSSLVFGGIISGFFSAVTGIGGIMRGALLSAFAISRYTYIATLASIGFVIDSARMSSYLISGVSLNNNQYMVLFCALPVSSIAIYGGRALVRVLPQELFKRLVGIALSILAIRLLGW